MERLQCWESRGTLDQREAIWLMIQDKGWLSDRIASMRFWIPEHKVIFAHLIDPSLKRVASEDYYL